VKSLPAAGPLPHPPPHCLPSPSSSWSRFSCSDRFLEMCMKSTVNVTTSNMRGNFLICTGKCQKDRPGLGFGSDQARLFEIRLHDTTGLGHLRLTYSAVEYRYQQYCKSVSAWNRILCLTHIGIEPATCVPDPLVRGTDPDSSVHQAKIVGILKVTDEKNRIRSRIRIRILKSVVRIRGSGSVSKCHGSGTLPDRVLKLS
jgi:hypothetical protein